MDLNLRGERNMEPQIVFQERPRASVGGKVFLVLEMIAVIFAKLCTFIFRGSSSMTLQATFPV